MGGAFKSIALGIGMGQISPTCLNREVVSWRRGRVLAQAALAMKMEAVAAVFLGAVHGDIRKFQQRVYVHAVLGIKNSADAGIRGDFMRFQY